MKKFFLRLPAQVLQSACLFVVAYTVLRIFGRISVIEFSLRPVLGLLAYCLLAAAFLGAMGREAGVIGTLGMLAVGVFIGLVTLAKEYVCTNPTLYRRPCILGNHQPAERAPVGQVRINIHRQSQCIQICVHGHTANF